MKIKKSILRPSSNYNSIWYINTYTYIDDIACEGSGGTNTDFCEANKNDDSEQQAWYFDVFRQKRKEEIKNRVFRIDLVYSAWIDSEGYSHTVTPNLWVASSSITISPSSRTLTNTATQWFRDTALGNWKESIFRITNNVVAGFTADSSINEDENELYIGAFYLELWGY